MSRAHDACARQSAAQGRVRREHSGRAGVPAVVWALLPLEAVRATSVGARTLRLRARLGTRNRGEQWQVPRHAVAPQLEHSCARPSWEGGAEWPRMARAHLELHGRGPPLCHLAAQEKRHAPPGSHLIARPLRSTSRSSSRAPTVRKCAAENVSRRQTSADSVDCCQCWVSTVHSWIKPSRKYISWIIIKQDRVVTVTSLVLVMNMSNVDSLQDLYGSILMI